MHAEVGDLKGLRIPLGGWSMGKSPGGLKGNMKGSNCLLLWKEQALGLNQMGVVQIFMGLQATNAAITTSRYTYLCCLSL